MIPQVKIKLVKNYNVYEKKDYFPPNKSQDKNQILKRLKYYNNQKLALTGERIQFAIRVINPWNHSTQKVVKPKFKDYYLDYKR